jgi:hypothetical protein
MYVGCYVEMYGKSKTKYKKSVITKAESNEEKEVRKGAKATLYKKSD